MPLIYPNTDILSKEQCEGFMLSQLASAREVLDILDVQELNRLYLEIKKYVEDYKSFGYNTETLHEYLTLLHI